MLVFGSKCVYTVNGHEEQDFRLGVAWVKADTSANVKVRMTWQKKQIATAEAEFAEQVAKGADKVRKQMYAAIECAATFRCAVEELVDMAEVTEEMKKPE